MQGKSRYRLLSIIALILVVVNTSFAQKKEKSKGMSLADRKARINQHSLFLELGGSGYYYTLNYETLLLNRKDVRWYGRTGLEWIPVKPADRTIHFPVISSVTFLKSKWQPEIGFGALFRINFDPGVAFGEGYYLTNPPTNIFFTPTLGVRYISKPNDHNETWLVKIAFTPLLGMDVFTDGKYFFPWFGVAIGRSWSNRNRKK